MLPRVPKREEGHHLFNEGDLQTARLVMLHHGVHGCKSELIMLVGDF